MCMQLVDGINMLMFVGAPILVAMAAFGTYSWQGKQLTADVAFPALAYFDLLRFPLIMLPWQIVEFVSARVALTRLQRFVDSEESDALSAWEAQVLAESVTPFACHIAVQLRLVYPGQCGPLKMVRIKEKSGLTSCYCILPSRNE